MVGKSKRLLIGAVVTCLLALLALSAFAASTGNIRGTITDKKNGEPVVGASVLIVGTQKGALTDFDGNFDITRVEPGIYVVRISAVGYNTVEVTEVEVKIDQTFIIEESVSEKVTELDKTITVTGKKDILDITATSGEAYITQEAIETKPVTDVGALLEQVAGVKTTAEGEVFVRGGRAGEVSYIVDGVPIDDPLGGAGQVGANLSLSSGSIADLQVIKDGFDPEYGNALSGIVNIRTRTGHKTNTRLNLQYLTDDLGSTQMNKYSRNFDYVRFSLSGPDPIFTTRILPSLGLNWLADKEFTYYIYADMDKNDGSYQLEDYDSPSTSRDFPSFNLLGIDIPERYWNRYTFQSNVKFRPQQNLKLVASYKRWYLKRTLFTSDYWGYRYSASTLPIYINDRQSFSLEVVQQVTKDMNYEVILSMTDLDTEYKPGDPDNPGRGMDPDDFLLESEWETYDDLNDNGVYDAPEPLLNLYPDTTTGENSGPAYTSGELNFFDEAGGTYQSNFRFNDNGLIDFYEGEPYIDLNGNGVWDQGDVLNDKNGNGILDSDRLATVQTSTTEPYVDGDSVLGEPFTDLNSNGIYDVGVDVFVMSSDETVNQDYNHNGKHDGPFDTWTAGIPFLDRNGNGIYDAPNSQYDIGEPYVDLNGNGQHDLGGSSTFLDPYTYETEFYWQETTVRTLRGETKVIAQMGRHELKFGFALQRDEATYGRIDRPYLLYTGRADTTNPYSDRGAFRDFYEYTPVRGNAYFRDKIEYGSMIASLGLRWDFFLQDTEELATVLRADDRGGLIEGDRHKFSPRIGFSYPISDKAKVYFNYGHFFQLPQYTWMYARNTSSVDQQAVLGNPNLDYAKTIQYSFGVKYKMSPEYSVDLQGYFKDEFDKINQTSQLEGQVRRNRYRNSDYGRSRGIEVTLEKRGGGYVNGQLSYTYAFAFGKASATQEVFDEFVLSREPLTESPLDNDIRHSLQAAITVYMPTNAKPKLFGIPIPNGWTLSIESIIESGRPFTPTSEYPGIAQDSETDIETNSLRYPATAVFDVRFSKEFRLWALDWQFILWVENVFDSRNVVSIYTNTGRPNTSQNQNGVVLGGSEYDQNPYHWDYGRQIRFGLELNI